MAPLRVGVDVSPLFRPHPRGVVRVAGELTAELERRGRLDVVRLEPPEPGAAGPSLRAWRQTTLPRRARDEGLAGIHSYVSAFPWRGPGARVATVHELPWRHGVKENADLRHRFWASFGRRRADRVVTATEHVARELGSPRNVRVIPWGVGPPFEDEPPPGAVDEPTLARYGLADGAFALCVGAVRPKKNLAAVLEGLAELRRRNGPRLQLVVTGEHTETLRRDLGLASKLGLAAWVSTPGPVDEADLPALYRLAAVVPCLSRSEGFGLPVLEALACGTPVVVPRGSAQAEVAGTEGILVDAGDAGSVAEGLTRAVRERETLRYRLAERARELTWSRTAERIEALWEELA